MINKIYAYLYDFIIDKYLEDNREKFVELMGDCKDKKVLDLCCGTGNLLIRLASCYPKAEFCGIDKNKDRTAIANKRKRRLKLNNIKFFVQDATSLNLNNNSFDIIIATLAVHELSNKEQDGMVREIKRVLKTNGNIYIMDFVVPLPKKDLATYIIKMYEWLFNKNFKNYQKNRGLPVVLPRLGLTIDRKICTLKNNQIAIVKCH